MKAFDTDILTEILAGNPAYAERIANVPLEEQSAPLVAIEEILRGRLNAIRQAEARKGRITIERAYQLFEETLDALRELELINRLTFRVAQYLQHRIEYSTNKTPGGWP